MDSINQNQPEENLKDLAGKEARIKVKELVEKAETCFFCTRIGIDQRFETRPMSVQKIDDEGNLWFLSATDSHKNSELQHDPSVQLLFQGSPHADFLSLNGRSEISTDKTKIKELWKPILKVWFTEGVDDPRISVIKVMPEEGYYWDTKHSRGIAFIKMLVGAAIGQTLDDSIEGKIQM